MTLINVLEAKNDLLDDYFRSVISRINECHENRQDFTRKDLLGDCSRNDYYYRYMTKGIILTLLSMNYIEIVGTYNGHKNYIYRARGKIYLDKSL